MDNILKGIVIAIISLVMASCAGKQGNNVGDVVEITSEFTAAVHLYDELYPFSEGLAAVMKDGKFGYINTKGELVVPCKFEYAGDFIDSTAVVVVENGKPFCILNHDGQIIETSYIFDHSTYYNTAPYYRLDSERIRKYVGVYEFETRDESEYHYLDKNLKEVAKPSDSLLRNFDTDTTKYETFVEQLQQTDIYGRTEHKVGIKDKEGKIIIPAKYDRILDIGENGVAVALLYFESAKSHVWEYRYGEGLSIYGYVDLTTGKSTFTDADFAKMEGYRQAQEEAYPGLKQQKEAEEQERLEEERRQMGTDFVVTMTADFNKYGELCNRYSNLKDGSRFMNSFETKSCKMPYNKRLKFLYYKNLSQNVSICGDIRIDVYSDNGDLLAQHKLNQCGEFNIVGGQKFRIMAYDIFAYGKKENSHFEIKCYFKDFDE